MTDRRQISDIVYGVIDEINGQLPQEKRLAKSGATVLVGPAGVLDSLGLVNLALSLERVLGQNLDQRIRIFEEQDLADPAGPLATVESLIEHILAQL